MPTRPDPTRPDWRLLLDAAGTPLGRFLEREREHRRVAEALELDVGVERALPTLLDELRGWRVAADEPLGRALVEAGARPVRHAHVLTRDLRAEPASDARLAPDGLVLEPLERDPAELVDAYRSAYPPEHVDGAMRVDEDPRAELTDLVAGIATGRLLDCSGLAVDRGGVVRAAVIVTAAPGDPPFGGPWVAECFRDRHPRYAGAGRALLERALVRATRAGIPALGLAVTEGNRAQRLYAALGFRRVLTSISVDL